MRTAFLDAKKGPRVVFVDGLAADELSTVGTLSNGVVFGKAGPGEVSLRVASGVRVAETFHLVAVRTDHPNGPADMTLRCRIVLEEDAALTLAMDLAALTRQAYAMNLEVDARLGRGASLDFYEIQRLREKGTCASRACFSMGRDSRLRSFFFANGGLGCRQEAVAHLDGENASALLNGFLVLNGVSRASQDFTVHHDNPRATSRQYGKSLLLGGSRSEFRSLVSVKRNAAGSDSRQMNRNLLLSPEVRAFSQPELRIDNDDVSCLHGSATGALDEDEIFYLRSRGFSEELAKSVLVEGFAGEILQEVRDPGLRQSLEKIVRAELGQKEPRC